MKTPPVKKNLRILIIDDNRAIHGDFRKILADERTNDKSRAMETALFGEALDTRQTIRFELDSAYQGKEGFEMVQRAVAEGRPYAMVFTDVRMPPGWDGVEPPRASGRSIPRSRSSSAPRTRTTRGIRWARNSASPTNS